MPLFRIFCRQNEFSEVFSVPRPHKPPELHILHGTWRRDRHGNLKGDLAPGTPPLKPPAWLGLPDEGKALWQRIVPPLIRAGIVREVDEFMLGEACRAYAMYKQALARSDRRAPKVWWEITYRILGKFGMTPSDRLKLQLPPPVDDSDDGIPKRWRIQSRDRTAVATWPRDEEQVPPSGA